MLLTIIHIAVPNQERVMMACVRYVPTNSILTCFPLPYPSSKIAFLFLLMHRDGSRIKDQNSDKINQVLKKLKWKVFSFGLK